MLYWKSKSLQYFNIFHTALTHWHFKLCISIQSYFRSQFAGWLFYTLDSIPEHRIMCLVWIVIQNFLLQSYSTLWMWRIVCMTVEPRLLLKIVWYEHMIYNWKSIHMQILWYMMWTNAIRCFCESLLLWLSFTDCT